MRNLVCCIFLLNFYTEWISCFHAHEMKKERFLPLMANMLLVSMKPFCWKRFCESCRPLWIRRCVIFKLNNKFAYGGRNVIRKMTHYRSLTRRFFNNISLNLTQNHLDRSMIYLFVGRFLHLIDV